MSTEENDTPPASPSWMQSQQPKTETAPPKSRKPRRTKAQMAEAKALSNLGAESVLMTPAEYTQIDDHTIQLREPLKFPKISWWERNRQDMILTSLVLSFVAIVIALVR